MTYTVNSHRLPWPFGTTVSSDDLAGCNIASMVSVGHLVPAKAVKKRPASLPDIDPVDEPDTQEDEHGA